MSGHGAGTSNSNVNNDFQPVQSTGRDTTAQNSLTAASASGGAGTTSLLHAAANQELSTFVTEQLPALNLAPRDAGHAQRYLQRVVDADPQKLQNGISVVTTSAEIMRGIESSGIVSMGQLIRTAEDLDLRSRELRDIASIATGQERSVARVGTFLQELAAAPRTDEGRDEAFRQATPEQRNRLIDDALELMDAVKSYERAWGETISMKMIAKLAQFGTTDEILRQLETLDESSMEDTSYSHYRFDGTYNSILRDFANWLAANPDAPFEIESFLDHKRQIYTLRKDRGDD